MITTIHKFRKKKVNKITGLGNYSNTKPVCSVRTLHSLKIQNYNFKSHIELESMINNQKQWRLLITELVMSENTIVIWLLQCAEHEPYSKWAVVLAENHWLSKSVSQISSQIIEYFLISNQMMLLYAFFFSNLHMSGSSEWMLMAMTFQPLSQQRKRNE